MYSQGYSLGKQLSIFTPALLDLIERAKKGRRTVWFLGRDCDVFASAFKKYGVRYITGLNRDNARKLQHRHGLAKWLKSLGVKSGDYIVDSGYKGTIFSRINADDPAFFSSIWCVLLTADPMGHTGMVLDEDLCHNPHARCMILALEHSPKREIVAWDETRRVPVVFKQKASDSSYEFFDGCVTAIKEGIKMQA